MTRFILLRHGESILNTKNVYFGSTDSLLSPQGEEQIRNKVNSLPDYDLIYSSPLKRAIDSAKIINTKNLPIKLDHRLKELDFGIFENKSYNEIETLYKNECEKWKVEDLNYKFPQGESIKLLSERAISFIEELKHTHKNILIVSHYGVINAILCHYICNNLDSFWKFKSSLASITTIEFHDDFPILNSFSI